MQKFLNEKKLTQVSKATRRPRYGLQDLESLLDTSELLTPDILIERIEKLQATLKSDSVIFAQVKEYILQRKKDKLSHNDIRIIFDSLIHGRDIDRHKMNRLNLELKARKALMNLLSLHSTDCDEEQIRICDMPIAQI